MISRALMEAYENSRSSPGLVGEFLEENSSDGKQSALLNGNNTPPAYLCSDKTKGSFRLSRYGMTLEPLPEDLGERRESFLDRPSRVETFHSRCPDGRSRKLSADRRRDRQLEGVGCGSDDEHGHHHIELS